MGGLVLTLVGYASLQAQAESQVPTQVRALVIQYDSAWNRQDTSTVSRFLAPRYQYSLRAAE